MTCEKTVDFLSEHFDGKTVRESVEEAKKVGFEISFINPVTDTDMRNFFTSCNEDELKKWGVKDCSLVKSEQKIVQLNMIYSGERTVPNVVGMSLKHAVSELKASGFHELAFKTQTGRSVKEDEGKKWKVIEQSQEAGRSISVDEKVLLTCESYEELSKTELFDLKKTDSDSGVPAEPESTAEQSIAEESGAEESRAEESTAEGNVTEKSTAQESTAAKNSETETEPAEVNDALDILNILEANDE